ncbi:hypothetical protein H0H92_011829 [Tricholoma furcatifolium]|nr:hypothetical protein H0H92_011829 [Tricholoma furcatifolium]
MDDQYTSIRVIPPQDQDFSPADEGNFSSNWASSSTENTGSLSLQIPQGTQSYQNQGIHGSPYLSSPLSPSLSIYQHQGHSSPYPSSPQSPPSPAPACSPGLLSAFDNFSIDEPWEPSMDFTNWNPEQDILPSSFSTKDEVALQGLDLTITVAPQILDNLHLNAPTASDEELRKIFEDNININFGDINNTTAIETSSFPDFATSQVSPIPSPDVFPPETNASPATAGANLQRRHSHSSVNAPRRPAACNAIDASLLSPEGHVDTRQQRRHSHSHSVVCASFMTANTSSTESSALLSPPLMLQVDASRQRRHSHSDPRREGVDNDSDQGLRRVRSTTSTHSSTSRNRSPYSPYPRPLEIQPSSAYPVSEAGSDYSSVPVDAFSPGHSTPQSPYPTPSPLTPSIPSSQDEEMFRRYDNASGIGYPILQRETIASDAVLEASKKRRKKPASYQCDRCGQMLTSRDNLNSMCTCLPRSHSS